VLDGPATRPDTPLAVENSVGKLAALPCGAPNASTGKRAWRLRAFPLKGHELAAWYTYRGMVNAKLLTIAFAPELAARHMNSIGTGEEHEIGGWWQWTLNPNFDIRLAGNIAFAAGGMHDLAKLANCNYGGAGAYATSVPCRGNDVATHAEARFRARF